MSAGVPSMGMSAAMLAGLVERLRVDVAPAILERIRAGAEQVETKAGSVAGDVVTDVDFAVQALLAERLPMLLPEARFVGEEDFAEIADPDRGAIWIVDPLDGTLNFANRIPFFGCSIALLWNGTPVAAFVLDADRGTVWDAIAGGGARRDGRVFSHDAAMAAAAPLSVSSGLVEWDAADPRRGFFAHLRAISPRLRILGSQALQLCMVAEGSLRVLVNRETRLWDDAAGWLICREAGAAHALARGGDLFPLAAGTAAVRGEALFSIAGEPALVDELTDRIRPLVGPSS